ncbi:MAG: cytochrome c biogenesis protein CcsA [Polyangiaceae bacterium]|nr:cytochrome c biogenesis protein CcsA [Polyangiaceae bacterium]
MTPANARRWAAVDVVFYALTAITAATFVGEIFFIFLKAPIEARMGIVQKIFYFHVPSAYAVYLGATACFAGSIAYLVRPTDMADAIARAGAEAAVTFGCIVLTTGPLWGAKAWGTFWTWDPRLTTELLSVLIYAAYVVLRGFAGDGDAERRFAAALGVLGAANLPIIHFSVQKWGGQHPTVITGKGGGLQHPDMKIALALGLLAFTFLAVQLVWARARAEMAESRLRRAEEDAIDLGLDTRTET